MAEQSGAKTAPITIKKYANRRLYNTATSSYVTLDHLAQMVKDGTEFAVFDAKTGEDITRSVLTQIIVEEEAKGQNLLPIGFLRQLIGFYGDSLQALVPGYLDHTMTSFAKNQEEMRRYMRDTLDGLFPFQQFEEMGKKNMAMFQEAIKMFTPFYGPNGRPSTNAPAGAGRDAPQGEDKRIDDLRTRLEAMQKQLDDISGGKS
jgi:polyhydroxyalkanoate synthesis repressor PhaR